MSNARAIRVTLSNHSDTPVVMRGWWLVETALRKAHEKLDKLPAQCEWTIEIRDEASGEVLMATSLSESRNKWETQQVLNPVAPLAQLGDMTDSAN